MAYDIILLKNETEFNDSKKSLLSNNYPYLKELNINNESIFKQILGVVNTSLCWIVLPNVDVSDFDFKYELDDHEKKLVNIFYTEFDESVSLCLVNKKIIKELSETSTNFYDLLKQKSKLHNKQIGISCLFESKKDLDIIFISYDEENAEEHFKILSDKYGPRVKRVDGVKGIVNAHVAASLLSSTEFFYVIDADAELIDSFNFDYNKFNLLDYRYVHIWLSHNPINGLEYGYGGVKIFHKTMFKKQLNDYKNMIDMSTNISLGVKIIPVVSCITRFNTSKFSTWRAAFRECAKLASNSVGDYIPVMDNWRLFVWGNEANQKEPFWDICLLGAQQGKEFGIQNKENKVELNRINDFEWLETRFRNLFGV